MRDLVLALQFNSTTPIVILRVVEVNETAITLAHQFVVELASQIIVIGDADEFTQFLLDFRFTHCGIETMDCGFEHIRQDIGVEILALTYCVTMYKFISESL